MQITVDVGDVHQMAGYWSSWWPRVPLLATVRAAAADARDRLETEVTAPDGSQWRPWSDNPPGAGYASRRPASAKLLRDTGALRDSIVGRQMGRDYVVASDVGYARVHQEGSRDGKIPRRQYVGISEELEQALGEVYGDSFEQGWSRRHG